MTFASPYMLLGLLVIAAAVVLYVVAQRRRGPGAEAFASAALAPAAQPRRPRWRRHLPAAIYALAGAALVIAVAKPQKTVAVPVEQATIVLVTDHSRSMQATDVSPNRLVAARSAADRLLSQVPKGVRVGAVAFNQRARVLQAPTTDRQAVHDALAALTAQGGTATGEGLYLGLASAKRPALPGQKPPPAAIVLLTDGKASNGRDVLQVAQEAKKAGIPVHTVALGTQSGSLPSGGTATTDTSTLRQIAAISGGKFRTAADADQLRAVYDELGSRLSTKHVRRQVTSTAAGGALLLLLAGAGFSLFSFGRLP